MHTIFVCMLLMMCTSVVMAQDNVYTDSDGSNIDSTPMSFDGELFRKLYKEQSPIGIRYTKKHPLIIVGNWSFRPYSFMNDHGEPDGFQVDLIKHVFTNLHVPYQLHLMDWKKAKQKVRKREAHLMVCIDKNDVTTHTGYSHSILAEYSIGIARNINTPKLRSIMLLTEEDTIYIMKGDYVDTYFKQYFGRSIPFHIEYSTAEDALNDISTGRVKYFLWGKYTLGSLVNRFDLGKLIKVDDIDIPSGRMRFLSNDSMLLHDLDMQLERIKAQGAYDVLTEKWFEKDGKHEKTAEIPEIIFIMVFAVLVVIVIIIVVVMKRGNHTETLRKEFEAISRISLNLTNCYVLYIDLRKMRIRNIYGDIVPKNGITVLEFDQDIIHPDDIQTQYDIRKRVDSGEEDVPAIRMRMRKHDGAKDDWRTMNITALIRKDYKNRPHHLYLVLTDETDHLIEQNRLNMALEEFAAVTDIAEIGMIYYDITGEFVNCNKALIDIFDQGGLNRAEQYLHDSTISDVAVLLNGIVVEGDINEWFCAPIEIPELNLKTCVEVRIRSVYNSNGNIKGYAIGMEDIKNRIDLLRETKIVGRNLSVAKTRLLQLHSELRFILQRNNMSTFRWQVGKDYFEVSQNLLSYDKKLSFLSSFNQIDMEDKQFIADAINDPVGYFSKPQERTFCFRYGAKRQSRKWMKIFTRPDFDENGHLVGAYGLRCDITEFMQQQENLRNETEKAMNSGRLKTIFLANMTHELRTPLNAINGFAEVMQFINGNEDKSEYVDIMKHNCNMLINLIDNILQLSMMDTEGVKIRRRDVNFAELFPITVTEMMKYITSPEVQFQVDMPMRSLIVNIDYERLMQILDSFVNNASKYTTKGFIRVGYRYIDGMLTIYCRDTGCGIPKEHQHEIFDRFVKLNDFVQGTGLGLTVSKMLAEKMGATIELYSREGEGSNFSVTIKC